MKLSGRLVVLLGILGLAIATIGLRAQSTVLVQAANVVHLGSFMVPKGLHSGGTANAGFEYGGTALAFNSSNNSLFIVGHDWDQFTGEISIPAYGSTATLLQPLVDSSEGKISSINPGSPNTKKIGGNLVWGTKLIVSMYDYYDANTSQIVSHISRPITLSTNGQVTGPFQVGPLNAGFYDGYMTSVPSEWQAQLGGPALTGQADLAIISRTSLGPAAFAFNPSNMTASGAQPLVYYPIANPTLGPWSGASKYYGMADTVKGVALPAGTSSVLFFGRHGTTACYGPGTSDPSLAGQSADGGVDVWCYDPEDGSKGVHGYPYVPQVWAYNASDLAAVHAGQKQPWSIIPYAVWTLPAFSGDRVGGAAYDPASGRLFVSAMFGDSDGINPLIHVYGVTGGSLLPQPPQPPTDLQVQ